MTQIKVTKRISNSSNRPNKLIERGRKTRNEILGVSVDIASAEGLEGLTIGGLAKKLEMSKSGLFAHFGSKEGLQLAAIERAGEIFAREIILPTAEIERGLGKLTSMLEQWISYVERSVFRGGCFFFAASAEMDDRPGRVKDFVAELTKVWVDALEDESGEAVSRGELAEDCDVRLLVFQVHGFVQEANWFYRLHGDETAFEMARRSIRQSIDYWATDSGKQILKGVK
jgi:AcrR family transcriptional regulator